MQKDRGGARAAVEDKADRPLALPVSPIGEIGDREDRRGRGAFGVGHRQGLGDRFVIEPAVAEP